MRRLVQTRRLSNHVEDTLSFRELIRRHTLDEFLADHVPLLSRTLREESSDGLQLTTSPGRRWGLGLYRLIYDHEFSTANFIVGAKHARRFVLEEFSRGNYLDLSEVAGHRFVTACRDTHMLAAKLQGRAAYEIDNIQKAEIVNVTVVDGIVTNDPSASPSSRGPFSDSAGVFGQSAVQRMLAIDVRFDNVERFQVILQDASGAVDEDKPKEELLFDDMRNWREESRTWRFEKALEDPSDCWMISDIVA